MSISPQYRVWIDKPHPDKHDFDLDEKFQTAWGHEVKRFFISDVGTGYQSSVIWGTDFNFEDRDESGIDGMKIFLGERLIARIHNVVCITGPGF